MGQWREWHEIPVRDREAIMEGLAILVCTFMFMLFAHYIGNAIGTIAFNILGLLGCVQYMRFVFTIAVK